MSITKHSNGAYYEDAIGYDGKALEVGNRIEIHPGTDLWMRGARYGTITGMVPTTNDRVRVEMDKIPNRTYSASADTFKAI